MKTEAPDIDRRALIKVLNAEYGLEVTGLTFVPKGEDSYGYAAETRMQTRYFIKVHDAARSGDPVRPESQLRIAHTLRTKCGLGFVVHAHETRHGRLLARLRQYGVSVFDLVEGVSAFEAPLSESELMRVATHLAAVHSAGQCPALPQCEREDFVLPFKKRLLAVLQAASDVHPALHHYRRELQAALRRERADIAATLERVERLAVMARQAAGATVLTHGDPTSGNIIRAPAGDLLFLDWGDAALGPPERDLVYFTGARFVNFLTEYVRALGRAPELYPEIFEYYMYRWALQEIADYGERILLKSLDEAENEHAWMELKQYLPIQHARLRVEVDEIRAVCARVIAGP